MHTTATEPDGRRLFELDVMPEIPFVLRLCRSLSASDTEAEELAHEVLRRSYETIDHLAGHSPKVWLYHIVHRCSTSRTATRGGVGGDADDGSELGRALADLHPRQRHVVDLVDVHGFGYEEAAQALGIPVDRMARRLHRGRRRLRRAGRTSCR